MTNDRSDDPMAELDAGVLAAVRAEADPGFARSLRAELRGRQARATQNLFWFDLDLPVGPIRLVHDEELIHLVDNDFHRYELRAEEELGFEPRYAESKRVRQAAELVLAGRKRGSEFAFLGALTPFQQAVLRTTARIPHGAIRPYGWVAREAGNPGAVRATGTTLGHNPVPFIVPCHRVVRSDWQLGKYSAGGPEKKQEILRMEGLTSKRLGWIQHAPRYVAIISDQAFCLPACEGLDETDPRNLKGFPTAEAALREGYEPCATCKPI